MKRIFFLILLFSFFLNIKAIAKENYFEEARKNYDNKKIKY